MKVISNKAGNINLPYEPGLLEWLNETYPFSKYYIVELA